MPVLTSQLLDDFPLSRYADSQTIQRGRDYHKRGRVWNVELINDREAFCQIEGDSGEYEVTVEVNKKGELLFECDCPYADEGNFCKHMVAAALEVSEYLKEEVNYPEDDEDFEEFDEEEDEDDFIKPIPQPTRTYRLPASNWRNKLDNVFLQFPRASNAGTNLQRYAAVLLIAKQEFYFQGTYSFTPYIIKARDWNVLQSMTNADNQILNDLLDKNHEWVKYGEQAYSQMNAAGCLNLAPEAVNLLNYLQQFGRFYGGLSAFPSYFALLAQMQVPVFLASPSRKSIQCRVQIFPNPVEAQVVFTRDKGNLVLTSGVKSSDTSTPLEGKAVIVSNNPPWLLMGDKLFSLDDSRYISLLSSFPISIPEKEADFFRKNYLRRVAELLPIKSDLIQWKDIKARPVPRLYLHDDKRSSPVDKDNMLRADLRYGYDEYEVAASKSGETRSVETVPDSWDLIRITREPEREAHFYQLLTDPIYRLKRADTRHPYGTFELRARAHPFDFLLYSIPLLTQAGFEIYGEENLKLGKMNRATPTLRVHITSGIDWFDLKTFVEFGDQQISFHDVRKALKRGERYIKLADGSVGQIPDEWLEKYKHLWGLAEETEDGFRLNDIHLSLLDSLLEEDATIQPIPDLIQRRERFRHFEQIAPQPLPEHFTGELRSYQKHGFDWLHFLHEYKFGGILADDMGLGKTVQVLAYLQSLKESRTATLAPHAYLPWAQVPRSAGESQDSSGERSAALSSSKSRSADNQSNTSLLIVPKSLIANWQRESEKFTPSLRFLEYMGNLRNKDTSIFNEYDVILTTYGTMLRDIEFLRGYKFQHVILDESQAIKNPLAKSAKATRLLKAEHRIVLTGTPVENNTVELWSQFAFLNPGLLGNMDYFKREFANPIEIRGDEESAKTLRKLVYPFILRRTKEQVAPELPPRTERIVYTDMNTAQKKIYVQTRDHYRAELLGLIESMGISDARFKILEGLLRLRQIAIHPALVEKNYKGDAPKFEVLLETLETLQAENHKALVFSQFVETLKFVKRELDARQIKYVYLDGQTSNRQSRVDLFQNDPSYPFFLISLKAGGVGLNLIAADYVIHLDPWWNPAVEMQASDRAHRIGQDKPVFIYKIITRDTVEEKILQLQEKKRALVKSLITTESSFFKSLTKDDVKMLFE